MENGEQGNAVWFVQVRTPYPTIAKGAVYSSDSNAVWSQATPFPVTADFAFCPPITTLVTASNASFNSDVSNITGGDYVTFLLTLINQGSCFLSFALSHRYSPQ